MAEGISSAITEGEDEVILGIGTELRVKSNALEQTNGSHIVHLTEINDDDDDDNSRSEPTTPSTPLTPVMKETHTAASPTSKSFSNVNFKSRIDSNTQWKQVGITIASGNSDGDQLDQLSYPSGLDTDEDGRCIYIADRYNHRILEWRLNANAGQVIAGGNGRGNQMNQLNSPTDVIINKNKNSLIICDRWNTRVVEWSCRRDKNGEIIISNINCSGLGLDKNGNLYVSDWEKNEVKRWKGEDRTGTIVAGGNGEGNRLNQLNYPTYIFVDDDESVYVSDRFNHRVMKWIKGAKEGIVVAGGHGSGNQLDQLNHPAGVVVDQLGNVYVADSSNGRIMCWSKGVTEGRIIVGGNGSGQEASQLNNPIGLSFDRDDNLYVVDMKNNRIQKFLIN